MINMKFYFFQRKLRTYLYEKIDKIYISLINYLLPKITINYCFKSEDALREFANKKNLSFDLREKKHILNEYKQHTNIRSDFLSGRRVIESRHRYFSTLVSFYKDNISILDFGGGFQSIHFPIIASNPSKIINTYVYEPFPEVVELNRKIHLDQDDIKFSDVIPKNKFDFIYFGSSIQYEFSIDIILSAAKKTKYVVISYSPMVLDGESIYAISVPHNNSFVPIKIWNLYELIEIFEHNGFVLLNQVLTNEDWNFGIKKYQNLAPDLLLRNSNFV
jgi:putative methyltransferase (TIGR04325 family)